MIPPQLCGVLPSRGRNRLIRGRCFRLRLTAMRRATAAMGGDGFCHRFVVIFVRGELTVHNDAFGLRLHGAPRCLVTTDGFIAVSNSLIGLLWWVGSDGSGTGTQRSSERRQSKGVCLTQRLSESLHRRDRPVASPSVFFSLTKKVIKNRIFEKRTEGVNRVISCFTRYRKRSFLFIIGDLYVPLKKKSSKTPNFSLLIYNTLLTLE